MILNEEEPKYVYVWKKYGVAGFLSNDQKNYNNFMVNMNEIGCHYKYLNTRFEGRLMVGKKYYRDCKWKKEYGPSLKHGVFELMTDFIEDYTESDEYWEMMKRLDGVVEIIYRKPRKLVKYDFTPANEPLLNFTDFNFKLAVVQQLMYEKELLLPKFDVYEFADEYPKREIDVLSESGEPIREVIAWFKKLEIPLRLADEIEEIHMDGGSDVYQQIIPDWDGEDEYFDLKKITPEDLAQFKNLKKMTVMSGKYKQIEKVLTANGIEADPL